MKQTYQKKLKVVLLLNKKKKIKTGKRKILLPGVISSTETCGWEAPTPKYGRIKENEKEQK